ncbi:MAG: two-component regulator propeller domain-containing protein [Bacteroidota bacterium]
MNTTITSLCFGVLLAFNACAGKSNTQSSDAPKVNPLAPTIWAIHQDQNGHFWFGSKADGLYQYDGQTVKHFTKTDGLIGDDIRGIQEDASGNLYIETLRGISKYDGKTFETLPIKESNGDTSQWTLAPTDLWFRIGFNKGGPYRYDGEYLHYLEFPRAPQEAVYDETYPNDSYSRYGIYTIYKDQEGAIWFGTAGMGLCQFDGEAVRWHFEEQLQKTPGGGDFGIRAIFQDRDGQYWINNTRYRYNILKTSQSEKVTENERLLDLQKRDGVGQLDLQGAMGYPYFLAITQDDDGALWMVTYDDGVWKYDGTQLKNYPIKDGDKEVLLFTIYKDRQGGLWLGTDNAGVYKWDGNSFKQFLL